MSDNWESYTFYLPPGTHDGWILKVIAKALGFTENDWCAMNREDLAHLSWGPMEDPGDNPPWALYQEDSEKPLRQEGQTLGQGQSTEQ